MHVNKTYLTQTIAEQTGLSKHRSSKAITTVIESMMQSLASGNDVKIAGFGKLYGRTLQARTGRHPKTGVAIRIRARKTVRFKCYKQLKDRLKNPTGTATAKSLIAPMATEQHLEPRAEELPTSKAVVRISGIPVCEFEVKDVSGNGTRILVEADSVILRNLPVGREIELHLVYAHRDRKSILQRSTISLITQHSKGDTYDGYVLVDLHAIDTLPIR